MKRRGRSLMVSLLLLLLVPGICLGDDLLRHPREMTFPPLSFTPPQADRRVLPNGMVIYLLEDRELPLIRLSALVRAGSIYDPPEKSGLAKLTAAVLRTGGSRRKSPRAVNEELESMAAELEFSMGMESATAKLSVQKKDFSRALEIFGGLLMEPAFDPAQVDLAQKQAIEALRRSNDDPEEIAQREFRRLLYAGNPRGQIPTLESLQSIRPADLSAYHRRFFQPRNILLGVSGDFQKEEMIASLERILGRWEMSLMEISLISPPRRPTQPAIYYAAKEVPQATIFLGHLSVPLHHPDHVPFQVLNFILGGGGFNSRLTQEIRSNQGLAYSVGSFYSGRVGYGVFGEYCQTKSETVPLAISLLLRIPEELKKNKPTPEELEWAKKSLINQFIFSFQSAESIVWQRMQLEYDRLPADWLERFPARVEAVSGPDLGRVAETHLHPDKALLLVVGDEKGFSKPLSSFGLVTRIELPKYD